VAYTFPDDSQTLLFANALEEAGLFKASLYLNMTIGGQYRIQRHAKLMGATDPRWQDAYNKLITAQVADTIESSL
jgi:hypothetical protein